MARTQISIKLDDDTLQRVDEMAEILGVTRTRFIERACEKTLMDQESLLSDMEGEGRIESAIVDAIMGNEKLRRGMAQLLKLHLSEEELAGRAENLAKLREASNKRKTERRRK